MTTGTDPGGGWGGTHPLWGVLLYNFWLKLLQDSVSEGQGFRTFLEACFQTPSKSILSVLHTLCKLSQHSIKSPTLNPAAVLMLYKISILKPKPATPLDLFLDQCLKFLLLLTNDNNSSHCSSNSTNNNSCNMCDLTLCAKCETSVFIL